MNPATAGWIAGWYVCAVVSNMTLKRYLNQWPTLAHVMFATWAAFATAAVPFVRRVWRGGEHGGHSVASATSMIRAELKRDALLVGVLHVLATGLTNVSILAATLAYAHTIKATEPIFTSLLSRQLLNEILPWTAHGAVMIVVLGVMLTSFSEGELSWVGLGSALAANLSSASRAVLFKRTYGKASAADAFARMSFVAVVLTTPLVLVTALLPPIALSAKAVGVIADGVPSPLLPSPQAAGLLLISSATSAGYFFCSFHVLTLMPAVSHALVNVMKRVVIIVVSIITFRTPVTVINIIGIFMANVGIGAYSLVLKLQHAKNSHHGGLPHGHAHEHGHEHGHGHVDHDPRESGHGTADRDAEPAYDGGGVIEPAAQSHKTVESFNMARLPPLQLQGLVAGGSSGARSPPSATSRALAERNSPV